MRMSHANLHLDTNATLTDTCVRQKVQAAITARQGKTHLNFKNSQPSLEILLNYWYIYDNVCTLLIKASILKPFSSRKTIRYISRGELNDQHSCWQSPPTTCLLTSNYNVSRSAWLLTNEKKKFQVGLFLQKRAIFRWISYKQKYCQVRYGGKLGEMNGWLVEIDIPILFLFFFQEIDGIFKLTSCITPGSHS